MTARKEGYVEVALPLESTLILAEKTLQQIGAKVKNRRPNTLYARKGASFTSWGEDIVVFVKSISADMSGINITSESALKITMLDWGKNASNIEEFWQVFTALANQSTSQLKQNTTLEGIVCPTCQQRFPKGTQFCPNDGTPMARQCTNCGHPNDPSAKFCIKCGTKM